MPTAVAAAVAPTSGVVVGFTPTPMNPIPTAGPIQGPQIPSTNASAFSGTIPTGNFTYGQGNPLNTNVYVTVQGSVTTEEDLVSKIASGLQQKSLSTGDVLHQPQNWRICWMSLPAQIAVSFDFRLWCYLRYWLRHRFT